MTILDKFIKASYPYRYASLKSKSIFLPGFQGLPLYDVIVFFKNQVQKVGLNDRARSIAFSFIMAIPAATIFLCTLIPYLPVSKKLTYQLLLLTKEITPNQNTFSLVSNFLNDFLNKQRGGLLSIGLFVALYYASNAMIGLMRSFNKSLPLRHQEFFRKQADCYSAYLVMILLLIGCIVILVTQDELLKYIFKALNVHRRSMKGLVKSLRWIVIIPLFYFTIAFIYRHAPSIQKKWVFFPAGSALACILFFLFSLLFSWIINQFGSYNKVYGSIGTILILMIVIYFNAMILLVGFELNVSIHSLKEKAHIRKVHDEETLRELAK
jgi:membrane protein